MRRAFVIALALLGLWAGPAAALDVKNVRSTYGPYGGVRPGNKFLPGDILWLAFELEDLTMEAETGLVKYDVKLEVLDSKPSVIFSRTTPNQRYLALGKARLSDRAQVVIGVEQAPGKYSVRLTITDKGGKDNKKGGPSKTFSHDFEIRKADFGLIHALSPSVAATNQDFECHCALTGMARDAKKLPKVELRLSIVDENGKLTLPKPFISNIPDDLPKDFDVTKEKLIRLPFPIFLNRTGRFTIQIEAIDKISMKKASVSFPLQVLETSAIGGK
jgi:hypothetical protein